LAGNEFNASHRRHVYVLTYKPRFTDTCVWVY